MPCGGGGCGAAVRNGEWGSAARGRREGPGGVDWYALLRSGDPAGPPPARRELGREVARGVEFDPGTAATFSGLRVCGNVATRLDDDQALVQVRMRLTNPPGKPRIGGQGDHHSRTD